MPASLRAGANDGRIRAHGRQGIIIHPAGASYTSRPVLVGYEGAFNELLQDILWMPMFRDFQPPESLPSSFRRVSFAKLRVVQTASVPEGAVVGIRVASILPTGTSFRVIPDGGLPRTRIPGTCS